jgi:hypothetical protein
LDDKQAIAYLESLKITQQRKLLNRGLSKAVQPLVKEYKKIVKQTIRSESYGQLFKGIGVQGFKKGIGVTIRINKKTKSINLLPLFEMGTKDRY